MIFTNQALALFPPALGQAIAHTQRDRQELVEEICCRIGQVPVLLTQAHVYPAECRAILAGDLDYLLERATGASVYAAGEQIRQGYLQTAGGCRVGVLHGRDLAALVHERDARAQIRQAAHALAQQRRFPVSGRREDERAAKPILAQLRQDHIGAAGHCVRNAHRHGAQLPDAVNLPGSLSVSAAAKSAPQFDVGANTDVMTGGQKAACCMMLLRAMRPDVLAFDEISAPEDIEAIRIAAGCGVALLATAHAQSVAALRHRALYRALLDEHIFRRAVCITRSGGERVYTVEDLT